MLQIPSSNGVSLDPPVCPLGDLWSPPCYQTRQLRAEALQIQMDMLESFGQVVILMTRKRWRTIQRRWLVKKKKRKKKFEYNCFYFIYGWHSGNSSYCGLGNFWHVWTLPLAVAALKSLWTATTLIHLFYTLIWKNKNGMWLWFLLCPVMNVEIFYRKRMKCLFFNIFLGFNEVL